MFLLKKHQDLMLSTGKFLTLFQTELRQVYLVLVLLWDQGT